MLHLLAQTSPSARDDYREFERWLLDWLLARMPRALVCRRDADDLAALHHMALRSRDRSVAALLRSAHGADAAAVRTGPGGRVPTGLTVFDLALVRAGEGPPAHVVRGGARDMRGFQGRMARMLEVLRDRGDVPFTSERHEGVSREESVRRALEALDEKVEGILAARVAGERGAAADADAVWPRVV